MFLRGAGSHSNSGNEWETSGAIGVQQEAALPNVSGELTGLKSVSGSYTNGFVKWVAGSAEGVYGSGGGRYGRYYLNASTQYAIYGRRVDVAPTNYAVHFFIKI